MLFIAWLCQVKIRIAALFAVLMMWKTPMLFRRLREQVSLRKLILILAHHIGGCLQKLP